VREEPSDHPGLRAAIYGCLLRRRGYTQEQAAALVIERYPWARVQLGSLAKRAKWDEWPAAVPDDLDTRFK
jgi:hypothetical protein